MCRLLAVVSSETTDFRFSLHEAPRSLAALSPDHPHGWGLAVHGSSGWELHKHAVCAREDVRFGDLAASARGELLIAHVRKKTVGQTSVRNTHPFRRGRWVFAHNGTIEQVPYLEARTSPARLAEIEGDTDSERLFAFLLTVIDHVGATDGGSSHQKPLDDALGELMSAATRDPSFGACNFLLSDGVVTYAYRSGRTLFLLERGRGDQVVLSRRSPETDATVETSWSGRRRAILIASEQMTDEPWEEIPPRALLRIDAGAHPTWTYLTGAHGSHSVR
jgi:predicted glutamine amidotransferase